ncbi:hypothetical protein JRQ81_002772 [Phrynocephalus forsythii]|uniref:Integrase catalytic domain-containing protein n=1 Tax=Phrynocephalus forsythii TaxID=171643 RepID=A0A9Q0XJI3_9SAUR|nr:hypothetical protein JRQ81_002772 [Phrynocephalus forsythii]
MVIESLAMQYKMLMTRRLKDGEWTDQDQDDGLTFQPRNPEVLTRQGANCMSDALYQMLHLLGVKPLKTIVYHPQANVLVEHFNKILKGMLRKLVRDKPKQRHVMVATLMFTVQEVPQASTGFSPFEMLYGKNPWGVLDLIREKWENGVDHAEINIHQVLEMKEHLQRVSEMAR